MDLERQPETPGARHGANGDPMTGTPNASACPADSQVFAFYENKLQFWDRRKIERHLATCNRCRESLALLARLHNETEDENDPVADRQLVGKQGEVDMAQVARVLAYIERSEAQPRSVRPAVRRPWIPAPTFVAIAAFLVLALGAFVIYKLYLSESSDSGLEAVANAVRKDRRTPVLLSGLAYSPYVSGTRGGGSGSDDLLFENAENKLSFAKNKSAPAAARLNLAKLFLARSEGPDNDNALAILQDLATAGVQSADVFNDTGVANYGLGHYAEAVDYFSKALAANPRMSEALFNKAVAEENVDQQAARRDYQKFIDSASDQRWIEEARGRLKSIR